MRRLPVYLVIDSSESMIGEANEAVNLGLSKMLASLRKNPYALETAWLSVITFDSTARVLAPLTDIIEFQLPHIGIRPGTALGAAIDLLAQRIKQEVEPTTNEQKGDFKPIVFFLTDGVPTDEWRAPLARFKAQRPRPANVCAIGCGDDVDYSILSQLADTTIKMNETSEEEMAETFSKLFVWLSASVQSASIGKGDDFFNFQDATPQGIERVGDDFPISRAPSMPSRVFIPAWCQSGKQSLLRFRYDPVKKVYNQGRAFKIPDNFSSDGASIAAPPISNELLEDWPACPYCNNGDNWIHCGSCGATYCERSLRDGMASTCPACHFTGQIAFGTFDTNTSLG